MAVKQVKTFDDIIDTITEWGKFGTDTATVDIIKRAVNIAYQEIVYDKPYSWSAKERVLMLKTKYTTGTISVTNASHAITGTSTVWSAVSHLGWRMIISGSSYPYKILKVGSTTSITLDVAYLGSTDTSTTYTMFKDEHGLFPALMDIRSLKIPGKLGRYAWPLPVTYEEINSDRAQSPSRSGTHIKYCVNGLNHYRAKTWATFLLNYDFFEVAPATNEPFCKNLILYPAIVSEDTPMLIKYTQKVKPLLDDDDEPIIPYENRIILVFKALLLLFPRTKDIQIYSVWKSEYKDYMKKLMGDVESTDDVFSLTRDHRGISRLPAFAEVNELLDDL